MVSQYAVNHALERGLSIRAVRPACRIRPSNFQDQNKISTPRPQPGARSAPGAEDIPRTTEEKVFYVLEVVFYVQHKVLYVLRRVFYVLQ